MVGQPDHTRKAGHSGSIQIHDPLHLGCRRKPLAAVPNEFADLSAAQTELDVMSSFQLFKTCLKLLRQLFLILPVAQRVSVQGLMDIDTQITRQIQK
jgi:hypothetical protein